MNSRIEKPTQLRGKNKEKGKKNIILYSYAQTNGLHVKLGNLGF